MAARVSVQSAADARKDKILNVQTRLEGIYVERKEERLRGTNKQDECVKDGQCEHLRGEEKRNKALFSALDPWRSFRLRIRIGNSLSIRSNNDVNAR